MKRLRLVRLVVQPQFVIDDGENLEPVEASQFVVSAAQLDEFVDRFRKEMQEREDALNAETDADGMD